MSIIQTAVVAEGILGRHDLFRVIEESIVISGVTHASRLVTLHFGNEDGETYTITEDATAWQYNLADPVQI